MKRSEVSVRPRQDTHGGAVLLEGVARQLLGKCVSSHLSIRSADVADVGNSSSLAFEGIMIGEVNMLASGAMHWVVFHGDGSLAIAAVIG